MLACRLFLCLITSALATLFVNPGCWQVKKIPKFILIRFKPRIWPRVIEALKTKKRLPMNLKKLSLFISATLLVSSVYLVSCKKDSTSSKDSDVSSAEDNSMAESHYNDVTTIVTQAAVSGAVTVGVAGGNSANGTEGTLGSACATISIDTVSSPHKIIVDFGATNCLCQDGRNRRGKIIASFAGKFGSPGMAVSITFDGYFVNDNQIKGTKTDTYIGLNNAGHPVVSISVDGQIIKANNGGTISWASTRQREWTAGFNTADWSDDVYSITGTANGITAAGQAYTITITKPLIRSMSCRWFESGTLDVTPQDKAVRTLDYGSTGCDANATVTILGYTFPIILH